MFENFGSWSHLTVAFLFVLYISLCGVVLSAALHLCNAKWRFQIRNLACSFAALFPVAGIMLLILLANGDTTFWWLQKDYPPGYIPGWHDFTFLAARQIIGFLVVFGMCLLFIKYQHLSEVDSSYQVQRRFRNIALLIPFVYFGYATMMGWDYEMTMSPNWHSSSYGAYHFQSMFHMFLAFFTVFLFFIYRSGRLVKPFQPYIFNYMAQFMLAMTILWTYLFFTQYIIMWYGRLPFEMDRIDSMMHEGFGPLWWTFLACKFVIPFVTLIFTPNRHNPVVITTVACFILFGTFLERYTWIAGSVDSQYYTMPMTSMFGIIAIVATIGVCWFVMSRTLTRYGLIGDASARAGAENRAG